MTVHFIGAGPGAPDLITLRASRCIADSPVCLYPGSRVPTELLTLCPDDAEVVDTARLSLDEVVEQIIAADSAGLDVARLHAGDPSIHSAVSEQIRRLAAAGVAYDLVPGVPECAAAAAVLGRELTMPGVCGSIVLTRVPTDRPVGEELRVLGHGGATLVVQAGVHGLAPFLDDLAVHYGSDCPAGAVAHLGRPEETVLRGTLATLAEQLHAMDGPREITLVVGRVLAAPGLPDSHLFSSAQPS